MDNTNKEIQKTLEAIIQWNAKGLAKKTDELRYLAKTYNPCIISIQESHYKEKNLFQLTGYKTYQKNTLTEPGGRAHGGVILMVRQNIPQEVIEINTNIQAIAV